MDFVRVKNVCYGKIGSQDSIERILLDLGRRSGREVQIRRCLANRWHWRMRLDPLTKGVRKN